MDEVDKAQEDQEVYERFRRVDTSKDAEETGYCLFCGDDVPKGHRWCCVSCRDAWEKNYRKGRRF